MTHIPHQARDGLMRAWLDLLQERHPDVTWIPTPNPATPINEPAGSSQPPTDQLAA